MSSRNIIKEYVEQGYYHVYNRGVGKRDIFLDKQDYAVFLSYIKEYLSNNTGDNHATRNGYQLKNFKDNIKLLSFCLMPNHFHLLIYQQDDRALPLLMKCLTVRYSMYFNKKYNRPGHLFQGAYKAVLIKDDQYLVHLSRYIHLNPQTINMNYKNYNYSSYYYYIKGKNASWLDKNKIEGLFVNIAEHEAFLEQREEIGDIEKLAIEEMHRVSPCAGGNG